MAAVSKKGMSPQRMQPTTFVLEGRPKSSESFGTTRQRFLNAPIPEPENEDEYFSLRPQKKTYSPVGDKKKKKQSKKKKKKGTKDSFDPNEDTREELRLQELKEKHMRVLDDLGKLKAHYYLEYMDALADKVEEQRKEIQRKTDANDRRIMRKEKKEKKEAQRINMEMHRPPVSSDNTFLKGLPKNNYHKIVVLQDKLIREGHIRRDEELRAFWEEIQRPEVYRRMFGEDGIGEAGTEHHFGHFGSEARTKAGTKGAGGGEIGAGDVDSQASSESVSESKRSLSLGSLRQVDPSHQGYLAQIEEVREPSRPGSMGGPYVQSWMNEPKTKKKHSQPVVTRRPVHPKVLEMEAKCPRVEFPQLAAFTLDLEPPKEDPEVEEMRQDFRTRARIRNSEVRRLRKMYQNSITNSAATQRLFDMKDELMQVLCGPALGDVVQLSSNDSSDHHKMLQRMRREEEEEEEARKENERLSILPAGISTTSHPTNPHPRGNTGSRPTPSFAIERISEEGDIEEDDDGDEEEDERKERLLAYSSRSSSRRSSLTSTESEIRRNAPVVPDPKRPQPLTMGAVMDKTEVKVVECPSTLWINYGKFLPSVH